MAAYTTVLLYAAVSICLSLAASALATTTTTTTTVRAGYYFAADAHLQPFAHLDASLYAHLYYSSLSLHPTRRTLQLPDDPAQARLLGTFSRKLKAKNPALRTLLSGATAGTDANPAPRTLLKAGFRILVSDLRVAAARGFLLTATVYFSNHVFGAGVEALAGGLDWVSVMAFGLRPPAGATSGSAGFTVFYVPLYDAASQFSVSYGVVSWLDTGVPTEKVVIGLLLYGRSWFLRNKANIGVGAPAVAAGPNQRESSVVKSQLEMFCI